MTAPRVTALRCAKCGQTFHLVSIAHHGPMTEDDIAEVIEFMACPEPYCWGDLIHVQETFH